MGRNIYMKTWTSIRHKLENEYLAYSLRGHIRCFAANMKKRRLVFLIIGCCAIVICLFCCFYPYPLLRDETDDDSYLQAYKLVKTRALIGKSYDECYDLLLDNGIDVQTEYVEFKGKRKETISKKEEIVYAKITYYIGLEIDWLDGNLRAFYLSLYFDEDMKVKFVDLAPNRKGG